MKKTTKNLSQKILSYGALTAAIAGFGELAAQNVYTDIDPDATFPIDDAAFPFALDIDGNGVDDFTISLGTATNGPGFTMLPQTSSNAFVGITAGNFQYPANLSSGVVVSSGNTFTSQGNNGGRGDLNFYGCAYSNSQFCGGEGYVGLKFDIAGATHYGWVRIENPADVLSATIKDYGYNATAGAPATTAAPTAAVGQFEIFNFTQFVANNELNLKANTAISNVVLFDVLGKQVFASDINSTNEIVSLNNLNKGVYFVEVTIDNRKKSFKIINK